MKELLITLAVLACAGAAFAQVNPTRPMMTGRGNVEARPARVIKTNATDATEAATAAADAAVQFEKFVVTGSLMKHRPAVPPARRK
jgi:hypothetical protein